MTTMTLGRLARRFTRFRYAERRLAVFDWGEISNEFGLGLELCLFDNDTSIGHWTLMVNLGWPRIYLRLPFRGREVRGDGLMESWGFSWRWSRYDHQTIHLHWGGERSKVLWMPWTWEQVRHEVQRADGSWAPWLPHWGNRENGYQPLDDGRHKETWPYRYVLRSGVVQERIATIYVERREHRWRACPWLPWPRKRTQAIDVQFSDEVGERSGSWKGGTVGCGYTMRPGETALQTLRRMEWERKFT